MGQCAGRGQGRSLQRGQLRAPSPVVLPSPTPYPLEPLLTGEANTLFRSNSLASKSMESFLKVRLSGIHLCCLDEETEVQKGQEIKKFMHPLVCSFAQLRLVSLSPLWAWLYPERTQQADGA